MNQRHDEVFLNAPNVMMQNLNAAVRMLTLEAFTDEHLKNENNLNIPVVNAKYKLTHFPPILENNALKKQEAFGEL